MPRRQVQPKVDDQLTAKLAQYLATIRSSSDPGELVRAYKRMFVEAGVDPSTLTGLDSPKTHKLAQGQAQKRASAGIRQAKRKKGAAQTAGTNYEILRRAKDLQAQLKTGAVTSKSVIEGLKQASTEFPSRFGIGKIDKAKQTQAGKIAKAKATEAAFKEGVGQVTTGIAEVQKKLKGLVLDSKGNIAKLDPDETKQITGSIKQFFTSLLGGERPKLFKRIDNNPKEWIKIAHAAAKGNSGVFGTSLLAYANAVEGKPMGSIVKEIASPEARKALLDSVGATNLKSGMRSLVSSVKSAGDVAKIPRERGIIERGLSHPKAGAVASIGLPILISMVTNAISSRGKASAARSQMGHEAYRELMSNDVASMIAAVDEEELLQGRAARLAAAYPEAIQQQAPQGEMSTGRMWYGSSQGPTGGGDMAQLSPEVLAQILGE